MLESCLDANSKRELQFFTKAAEGKPILFSEYWGKLTYQVRRRHKRVRTPQNAGTRVVLKKGHIDLEEWRDFNIKFLDIWHDLPSTSVAEEAYQLLIEKLPPFESNWVVEEQEKRNLRAPKATISPMGNKTRAEVMQGIEELIEVRPKDAWSNKPGTWVLQFDTERPVQELIAFKGKKLRGATEPLKITRLDAKLNVMELFDHVERKFNTKAKQYALNRLQKGFKKQIREVGDQSPSRISTFTARSGEPKAPAAQPAAAAAPGRRSRSQRAARAARRKLYDDLAQLRPPTPPRATSVAAATAPGLPAAPPVAPPVEKPKEPPHKPNAWNNGPPPGMFAGKGNGKGEPYRGKGKGNGVSQDTWSWVERAREELQRGFFGKGQDGKGFNGKGNDSGKGKGFGKGRRQRQRGGKGPPQ